MSQVVQLIRQVVRELAGYMDQLVPQVRIHKLHVLQSFIFLRGVPKKTLHQNSSKQLTGSEIAGFEGTPTIL